MDKYNWIKIIIKLIAVISLAVGSKGNTLLSMGSTMPPAWKLMILFEILVNIGNFLLGLFTNASSSTGQTISSPVVASPVTINQTQQPSENHEDSILKL